MKSLSFIVTIEFIIGIIMGLYLKISIAFLLFFCSFILMLLFAKNKKKYICFLIIVVLGFSYTYIRKYDFQNRYSDINNINITVKIVNIEKISEYYTTYKASVISINNNKNSLKYKTGYVYIKAKTNSSKEKAKINLGDIVNIEGSIEEVAGKRNYKGFDYQNSLYSSNVYAIIKADKTKIIQKNRNTMYALKEKIINQMKQNLNCDDYSICLSLLIGYKAEMSNETKDLFSECNISHLFAISGMHISIIIVIVNLLMKKIQPKKAKIIIIFVLIGYLFLIGFTPAIMRACIMYILTILSNLGHRKANVISNLSISAIILFLINPMVLLNSGFIFSFIGTFSIILFYEIVQRLFDYFMIKMSIKQTIKLEENLNFFIKIKEKIKCYIIEILKVSISANILIMPILIYNFNSFSFVSIFFNIIASPIITIIIVLSFIKLLLSSIHLCEIIRIDLLIHIIINVFLELAEAIRNYIPRIIIVTPSLVTIGGIYAIIGIITYLGKKRKIKYKILG